MGKNKPQTTTTGPDQQTQDWIKQIYGAAQGASNMTPPGVNPLSTQAAGNYGNYANAGNLGIGALSGDPSAMGHFMNPFMSGVIDPMNAQWAKQNQATASQVGDMATQAGAFGGDRYGVALGTALSQNNLNQAQQMGGLQYQGFNDAMGRAGQMANLGMGANQQMAGMGDYMRNIGIQSDPNVWKMNMLRQGMAGLPYGQTQRVYGGHNAASGALGGALSGASAGAGFGPWGAGGGAVLGGLLGAFGG